MFMNYFHSFDEIIERAASSLPPELAQGRLMGRADKLQLS
jgi:hypothetical protein